MLNRPPIQDNWSKLIRAGLSLILTYHQKSQSVTNISFVAKLGRSSFRALSTNYELQQKTVQVEQGNKYFSNPDDLISLMKVLQGLMLTNFIGLDSGEAWK
jgi:hypothetical protein